MKPPAETIRITKQGRDQLSKLRKQTGVEHWNALCRWAFCVSLREPTRPPAITDKFEGGVEMTWKVFSGDQSELFAALTRLRARQDGFALTAEGVGTCLRAHIHRGLAYLASGKDARNLTDITKRWLSPGSDSEIIRETPSEHAI